MSSLDSLDMSKNNFRGPLPANMPKGLKKLNASDNELSGVVPENPSKFPSSSFYPGNNRLQFPNGPSGATNDPDESFNKKPVSFIVKVVITVSSVIAVLFMLALLSVISSTQHPNIKISTRICYC